MVFLRKHRHTKQKHSYFLCAVLKKINFRETWCRLDHRPPGGGPRLNVFYDCKLTRRPPAVGRGGATRYRYRSIEAARGIAIELSKYHSIGRRPDGSFLTLFLDTGAKNSRTNLLCSVHFGDDSIGFLPRKSGYFFGSSVKIVARPLTTASTSLDAW